MKKLLLSLGALATVVAPVAAVVSCTTDKGNVNTNPENTNPENTNPGKVDGETTEITQMKKLMKVVINKYAEDSDKEDLLKKLAAVKNEDDAKAFAQLPKMAHIQEQATPEELGMKARNENSGAHSSTSIELTDADKTLSSKLFKDELDGKYGSYHKSNILEDVTVSDIESHFGITFSDNSKTILKDGDSDASYTVNFDKDKSELSIKVIDGDNKEIGTYVFNITPALIPEITSTTLDITGLENIDQDSIYNNEQTLVKLDNIFGTTLDTDITSSVKTIDRFDAKYDKDTQILSFKLDDVQYKYKIMPVK